MFCVGFEVYFTYYFKRFVLDEQTFVSEEIVSHTFPYFRRTTFEEYLLDDFADDEPGGGVEVVVEKQYLTVTLALNLLRFLT